MSEETSKSTSGAGMDSAFQAAFEGIRTHIESVRTEVRTEVRGLEKSIKRVDEGVNDLRRVWQKDHDRVIQVEEKLASHYKEFTHFREQEKLYGKEMNRRIGEAEGRVAAVCRALEKLNLSTGRIIGMALGAGSIIGVVVAIIIKLISKII